ncbi:hypothetical protein [Corynebacterium ulceribovis]|uniref:hypothetical protein n=1 Tax=Corynebacterium ulceribovis TaxID=487732 RepID=UPI00035C5EA1|nr:hypothetical protein [Corynebacterium ulceribovis]
MSYLIRVQLPDTPGSLGELAVALGAVDVDIISVDAVTRLDDGIVIDDMVLDLPQGRLPDVIITAAHSLDGVEVDSIRPYSGTVDKRSEIKLLADVAEHRLMPKRALQSLVDALPQTNGWALVLQTVDNVTTRVVGSIAAPEDDGRSLEGPLVTQPQTLDPEAQEWVPETWALLESPLCAAPINERYSLVVGRPGGPDYLPNEVEHYGYLAQIVGAMITG